MERHILIEASRELSGMRLEALAGRRGQIVEDLAFAERRIKGYMVMLEEAYEGEFLWFVPKASIK